MKEILKLAKSLSDSDLSSLIKSLNSLLEKRKEKALKEAKQREEQARAVEEVKQQIAAIAAEKGVSLEMLGYQLSSSLQTSDRKVRRPYKISPEKQSFYIDASGRPQLLFTRQLKQYKAEGLALTFDQLTPDQQSQARALIDARNAKA